MGLRASYVPSVSGNVFEGHDASQFLLFFLVCSVENIYIITVEYYC